MTCNLDEESVLGLKVVHLCTDMASSVPDSQGPNHQVIQTLSVVCSQINDQSWTYWHVWCQDSRLGLINVHTTIYLDFRVRASVLTVAIQMIHGKTHPTHANRHFSLSNVDILDKDMFVQMQNALLDRGHGQSHMQMGLYLTLSLLTPN